MQHFQPHERTRALFVFHSVLHFFSRRSGCRGSPRCCTTSSVMLWLVSCSKYEQCLSMFGRLATPCKFVQNGKMNNDATVHSYNATMWRILTRKRYGVWRLRVTQVKLCFDEIQNLVWSAHGHAIALSKRLTRMCFPLCLATRWKSGIN